MQNHSLRIVLWAVLIVVVLVGLFAFGKVNQKSTAGQAPQFLGNVAPLPAAVTVSERAFDFGTISMANGPVRHSFTVSNRSGAPMIAEKLYTSCMCTSAALKVGGEVSGPFGMPGHGSIPTIKKAIPAGADAVVEVTFDPAAHGPAGIGPIERIVYLETDAGAPLEFGIKANVTP